MTDLSLAARNLLAQDTELTALLGASVSWDTWIFDETPIGVKIEQSQRCWIVIFEDGTWTSPNGHNTLEFPRLTVDIWADPTRNADKSVKQFDAKTKINRVAKLVKKHFHLVDLANSSGNPIFWGTSSQISSKTGVLISASQLLDGPSFSPVSDGDGAWMARYHFGVNVVN